MCYISTIYLYLLVYISLNTHKTFNILADILKYHKTTISNHYHIVLYKPTSLNILKLKFAICKSQPTKLIFVI